MGVLFHWTTSDIWRWQPSVNLKLFHNHKFQKSNETCTPRVKFFLKILDGILLSWFPFFPNLVCWLKDPSLWHRGYSVSSSGTNWRMCLSLGRYWDQARSRSGGLRGRHVVLLALRSSEWAVVIIASPPRTQTSLLRCQFPKSGTISASADHRRLPTLLCGNWHCQNVTTVTASNYLRCFSLYLQFLCL